MMAMGSVPTVPASGSLSLAPLLLGLVAVLGGCGRTPLLPGDGRQDAAVPSRSDAPPANPGTVDAPTESRDLRWESNPADLPGDTTQDRTVDVALAGAADVRGDAIEHPAEVLTEVGCLPPIADQVLLVGDASYLVSSALPAEPVQSDTIGQSFVPSMSGQLWGMEILATRCDAGAVLELDLYQGNRRLATATRAGSGLCDGATSLALDSTGAGTFDLSSACVWLTSGVSYRFLLTATGGSCIVARNFDGNSYRRGEWSVWTGGTLDNPTFREISGSDTLFKSLMMPADPHCPSCVPRGCADVKSDLALFVETNRSCSTNSDCRSVRNEASPAVPGEWCCSVGLAKQADTSRFSSLVAEWGALSCGSKGCDDCVGVIACKAGICVADK
jgi:hypothetical protein